MTNQEDAQSANPAQSVHENYASIANLATAPCVRSLRGTQQHVHALDLPQPQTQSRGHAEVHGQKFDENEVYKIQVKLADPDAVQQFNADVAMVGIEAAGFKAGILPA